MLRYDRQTKPGLVALYDIRPGNGAGPFLQPRSPHGAVRLGRRQLIGTPGDQLWTRLRSRQVCHERKKEKERKKERKRRPTTCGRSDKLASANNAQAASVRISRDQRLSRRFALSDCTFQVLLY